ncbi:MerR family DNA-binding transcriptional regulator [Phenylobacterium sp. J426]|uniref:MerR family transcriptional regulator n=1 Tax=Phenylobacterium sp. J426 TaxID=2898439 RepID=UPI002150A115|nr:MerR family DNA-binding transcriptional regulator [Phenylobacterium sp. J426]MCR5874101.1 MerR family DNA-binding transcriptional regulator [Phenylobacterium sp. J426]
MPTDLRRPLRTYTIRQLCLEFKCTPRALRFYEDKGLLTPARDGMNRVYSYRDRARLQLILRGKRVGLSLAEIGEILDLYEADENGAAQAAKSLRKFKERIVALEQQKNDIDAAIAQLQQGISEMERRLTETRPDLLPRAADYDQMLRRRLDDLEHGEA